MTNKLLKELKTKCLITLVLYKADEIIRVLSNRHSLIGHDENTLTNIEDITYNEFWNKWLVFFNHYKPKDGIYISNPIWGINIFKESLTVDNNLVQTILNIEEGISFHPEFDHDIEFNTHSQYEKEFTSLLSSKLR